MHQNATASTFDQNGLKVAARTVAIDSPAEAGSAPGTTQRFGARAWATRGGGQRLIIAGLSVLVLVAVVLVVAMPGKSVLQSAAKACLQDPHRYTDHPTGTEAAEELSLEVPQGEVIRREDVDRTEFQCVLTALEAPTAGRPR